MTVHGTWVSYSGTAEVVLAVVLAAAAAAVVYAGIRLPLPARLPRPSRAAKIVMLAIWGFAVAAVLVCFAAYIMEAHSKGLHTASPITDVAPITLTGAAIVFVVIARAQEARGRQIALASAVIGTAAGLMIFEFPFDLIIMARTHPVVDPALFRLLLFGPLLLAGITTLALLSLSPAVRLRRSTLWCLAGMLAVFAVWSLLFGFSYPSAPGPIALNALSKILALVTALTLFLPERVQSETPEVVTGAGQPQPPSGTASPKACMSAPGLQGEVGRGTYMGRGPRRRDSRRCGRPHPYAGIACRPRPSDRHAQDRVRARSAGQG